MPFFHDLSPIVIPISGDFAVRWYGLSYVAGFIIAYFVLMALAKRGRIQIPPLHVADAMMLIVIGTLVGGRLGYAIFYEPKLLYGVQNTFPWLRILAINQGGMASHGGMAGILWACWRISRGWKEPGGTVIGRTSMLHIMDLVAMVSCFGLFLGRIANFINGELLGKIVSPPGTPGPWWSVQFPHELKGWVGPFERAPDIDINHTPALSQEQQRQLAELVVSTLRPGEKWGHALDRIIAHAGEYKAQLVPLLSSRHPSQLYQAVAEGLVLGAITWTIWMRPRKPGVVAGWWLLCYGVLRIATETIRLPDAQFGEGGRPLGLSRGQWLSTIMVVAGAALVVWCSRRAVPALGGWFGRRDQAAGSAGS